MFSRRVGNAPDLRLTGEGGGSSELIVLAVLIGLILAAIAQSKGHNFMLWWLFGAALFIVALPCALIIGRDQRNLDQQAITAGGLREVSRLGAEMVRAEARKRRFCGADLAATAVQNPYAHLPSYHDPNRRFAPRLGRHSPAVLLI